MDKGKEDYGLRRLTALACSKARFILIKNIWIIRLQLTPYLLELDGQTILFDLESLVHSLCRHYGEVLRAHPNNKSFFSRDLVHNQISEDLEEIFRIPDYNRSYTS